MRGLEGVRVTDVACGWEHSVACDDQGQVWTWGRSAIQGVESKSLLGHARTDAAAAGAAGDAKKGDEGEGKDGQDGDEDAYDYEYRHMREHVDVAGKVVSLHGRFVVQVAAGDCHWLALTRDGRLFGCGRNDHGELGQPHNDREAHEDAVEIVIPIAQEPQASLDHVLGALDDAERAREQGRHGDEAKARERVASMFTVALTERQKRRREERPETHAHASKTAGTGTAQVDGRGAVVRSVISGECISACITADDRVFVWGGKHQFTSEASASLNHLIELTLPPATTAGKATGTGTASSATESKRGPGPGTQSASPSPSPSPAATTTAAVPDWFALADRTVTQISSSKYVVSALTASGRVYSWNCDSEHPTTRFSEVTWQPKAPVPTKPASASAGSTPPSPQEDSLTELLDPPLAQRLGELRQNVALQCDDDWDWGEGAARDSKSQAQVEPLHGVLALAKGQNGMAVLLLPQACL